MLTTQEENTTSDSERDKILNDIHVAQNVEFEGDEDLWNSQTPPQLRSLSLGETIRLQGYERIRDKSVTAAPQNPTMGRLVLLLLQAVLIKEIQFKEYDSGKLLEDDLDEPKIQTGGGATKQGIDIFADTNVK